MLIATTPHFQIWRFYAHNSLRNYTYVVLETTTRNGVVIDPWDGEVLLNWATREQVKLTCVLNTHSHHDHIRGNEELLKAGVPLKESTPFLSRHAVPGHTMDHVAFVLHDAPHIFPGDTLFQAGVGNCKNGGDPGVLFHTVQQLSKLMSDATVIHPGHDYLAKNLDFAQTVEPSNSNVRTLLREIEGKASYELPPLTWAEEKLINPFLRLSQLKPHLASEATSDEMLFRQLRSLRDHF